MTHLYEMTAEMSQLWAMLDEDGTGLDDIADTMEMLELDFADKVGNTVKLVKQLKYDALACKAESSRLADRAKRIESRIKWLNDYLTTQMTAAGRPKLQLPEFTVTVRTAMSTVQILNEDQIPDDYAQIIRGVKYDKKAIRESLIMGDEVPGACLLDGKKWLDVR